MRSLRSRLVLLLCLFLVAATGMGFLLLAFYRESATAEIKRSEAVVARACDSIRDRYATSRFDRHIGADANDPAVRRELNAVVQGALSDDAEVEGGIWQLGAGNIAYGFPTYEGTGPKTDVPAAEIDRIRDVNLKAVAEQPATIRWDGRSQTILLHACALRGPTPGLSAWTMTRVFKASRSYDQLRLGFGLLFLLVVAAGVWITRIVMTWSRNVTRIEHALGSHDVESLPRLAATGERELDRIIDALNDAAHRLTEGRRQADALALRISMAERLAALGRMTAGIAHEIRNPIAAMRLKGENALAAGDAKRYEAAIRTMLQQIDRLDALLGDLLTLTHRPELKRQAVRLSVFVDMCFAGLAELADKKGVTLSADIRVDNAVFDVQQMRSALDNLLLNAIEATPAGGTIRLAASVVSDRVRFHLHDSGPGVPPAIRGNLFEPFVTGRADGTGLGLSIASDIVRAHGGEIRLLDTQTGALFEIELPCRTF